MLLDRLGNWAALRGLPFLLEEKNKIGNWGDWLGGVNYDPPIV